MIIDYKVIEKAEGALMRRVPWLLCLLLLVTADITPAADRVALVIGNGNYESAPLKNPPNDAQDIAAALRRLGFAVILRRDADLRTMEDAIRQFSDRLRRGEIGLFYYAGHGMQVRGSNFLIPVGSDIQAEDEVRYKSVNAHFVLDKMEAAGNSMNIVILDACRDNPFARSFRSSQRGLARMDAPRGSIIAYATAPGSVASDGAGRNGIYTKRLLENMQSSGMPIEHVFKQVRIGVLADTDGRQVPWESSSLIGDFYFAGSDAVRPVESTSATVNAKSQPATNKWPPAKTKSAPTSNPVPATEKNQVASWEKTAPSRNGTGYRPTLKTKNTSKPVGDGRWDWSVFIDADPETLGRIKCVEYTLHKTFRDPVRKSCNPQDKFALSTNGWGTFRIQVKVLFEDGGEQLLHHDLVFRN